MVFPRSLRARAGSQCLCYFWVSLPGASLHQVTCQVEWWQLERTAVLCWQMDTAEPLASSDRPLQDPSVPGGQSGLLR